MIDLVIIGGGPAGLSAATNGVAEGMSVTLLEAAPRFGGQAGTSSRIENYLGFPDGLSGAELARRSVDQARRLGAALIAGVRAIACGPALAGWRVTCDQGTTYDAHAVLIAAGVDYRLLEIPGADSASVVYGAAPADHRSAAGLPVAVVGGGNSAGQAAVSLARAGARVALIARSPLDKSMSAYLRGRIAADPRIRAYQTAPAAYDGAHLLLDSGELIDASQVFPYIGAAPRTGFLRGVCGLDSHGFVITGDDFATGAPGLFAAGDVRAGSRKRVQAATGEAAQAIPIIWHYVRERPRAHA